VVNRKAAVRSLLALARAEWKLLGAGLFFLTVGSAMALLYRAASCTAGPAPRCCGKTGFTGAWWRSSSSPHRLRTWTDTSTREAKDLPRRW